jgi:DNA polymerase III delta prime subunit
MFTNGIKFIVLDEVDYMTKNAQQALKYLLQEYQINIRFFLICNYISKIDESLQNEFVKLRFNKLPKMEIITFLNDINRKENLNLSISQIESIHNTYKSDIRSMINYMQSNQIPLNNSRVIDNIIYEDIDKIIKLKNLNYCNYYIRNNVKNVKKVNSNILNQIEFVIHNNDINQNYKLNYLFYIFSLYIF